MTAIPAMESTEMMTITIFFMHRLLSSFVRRPGLLSKHNIVLIAIKNSRDNGGNHDEASSCRSKNGEHPFHRLLLLPQKFLGTMGVYHPFVVVLPEKR